MENFGVALIGANKGEKGYGLGPYILNLLIKNKDVRLIAISGSSKKKTLKQLKQYQEKEVSDILIFSRKEINSIFNLKDIKLVIIASPSPSHFKYIKNSIYSNMHVLVEKPIFGLPLSLYKQKKIEEIFLYAQNKQLSISTICQRAIISEKIKFAKLQNLNIEFFFGEKDRILNSLEFFLATISHPLSIIAKLNNLDLLNLEIKIKKLNLENFSNYIEVYLIQGEISCKFVLAQKLFKDIGEVFIKVNEDPKIRISTAKFENELFTEITKGSIICYEEEHYSLTIKQMILSLITKKVNPIISNNESLIIFKLEKLLYKAFIES